MSERRNDFELLRAFVRKGDQIAFADLVRRHVDLVYATTLRKVEDAGAAQEVAQNVFSALARKAWRFARDDSLPAWLYKTTLLEAKEWLRGELRRRRREQTAAELGTTMKTHDEQTAFRALLPLLDEALQSLREKDRTALLLRFYESQSLREVGVALGTSEDTAQKRVAAALENISQFFQRRGFRTASVGAATAALQHTATAAPGFMATSVATAALKAAPAVTGLKALFGRLLSLSKAQMLSISVVALSVPALWYWQFDRSTPANASLPTQTQAEIAQGPQARPAAPETADVTRPVTPAPEAAREPAVVTPVTVATPQAQKDYSVHLIGFVNIPDLKIALLEIRRQPGDNNAPASIERAIVSEGKKCGNFLPPNDHLSIEFLHADFDELSARMRENGEEVVYTLERAMPPGEHNICLADADFDQVVDLYAELMNRTMLCHPLLHRIPISVVAQATDRNEVIATLGAILEQQTQTATIMDGDTFAVLAPTNLVKSVTNGLKKIPYPAPAGPKQRSGSINFVNVPTSAALQVYGEFLNRELIPANNISPASFISFHNQTRLNNSEIIHALDVLFSWQNWKVSLVGDKSFKVVPFKNP